jgi:hypothetical protein
MYSNFKEVLNMAKIYNDFIKAIANNGKITGYKAYYKINDDTVTTPEYSLQILKLYMEEFENQYPQAIFIGIEDQETGEVITENVK